MPKYIAFLRAINVGGHTVKMDQLRSLFEAMGFSNVETFIASGNVIFNSSSGSSSKLERRIEKNLFDALGYPVGTFIRTPVELAAIAQYAPFGVAPIKADGVLYIGFLSGLPTQEAIRTLVSQSTKTDEFHIALREVYWLCRTNFGDSKFSGARLEKILGMPTTIRNSTTVRKLAARHG